MINRIYKQSIMICFSDKIIQSNVLKQWLIMITVVMIFMS